MNKVVKSVLIICSLSLLGGACVKGENTNVNIAQNSNTLVNANSVDTSDWLTYMDVTYGFSFMYPPEYIVSVFSTEELYLQKEGEEQIKIYIQPYAKATEQNGVLYSKNSLLELKDSIATSNTSVSVHNIMMMIGYGYDVPGGGFIKETNFFVDNNFIKVSAVVNPEGVQYPTHPFNDETRSWANGVIEQLNKGQLLSPQEEQRIEIFDNLINSVNLN